MSIITDQWNGFDISIVSEDLGIAGYEIPKGYVNATEMCKANGKFWADYKRLKSTAQYWEALKYDMGKPMSFLVIEIVAHGDEQATWVHPEIAIDLATWVSPKFRVWVIRRIRILMETGEVKLEQKPVSQLELAQLMLDNLKQHEQRLSAIEIENIELKAKLAEVQETSEIHDLEITANTCELERFKNGHGNWFSIVGYAKLKNIKDMTVAKASALGRKASAICRSNNIKPETVPDPRFGTVQCYPDWVLSEIM